MIIDTKTIDAKRLGQNIRGLRNYYGETQENLAIALHTSSSNISMFETGVRLPSVDLIIAIAQHYSVLEDMLIYADYSSLGRFNPKNRLTWKGFDVLFPILTPISTLQNPAFLNAVDSHLKIREQLRIPDNVESNIIDDFFVCYDSYQDALSDNVAKHATAANLTSLLFLFQTMVKLGIHDIKTKPAYLLKIIDCDHLLRRDVFKFKSIFKDYSKEINSILNKCYEESVEMISILKEEREWSTLGDYFFALQYYLGIVENDLDYIFNQRIGFELLRMLRSLKNEYATQLIDYYSEESTD